MSRQDIFAVLDLKKLQDAFSKLYTKKYQTQVFDLILTKAATIGNYGQLKPRDLEKTRELVYFILKSDQKICQIGAKKEYERADIMVFLVQEMAHINKFSSDFSICRLHLRSVG